MSRQLILDKKLIRQVESGGSFGRGRRKERRIFSSRQAIHLVFRSEKARGNLSFLHRANRQMVEEALKALAALWGIVLYDRAVNTNHIHVLVRARSRANLTGFLRTFPGLVAMKLTRAKKGNALPESFWSERVYSRLVSWGREFHKVKEYLLQNVLEAAGAIAYTPRTVRRPRGASG